jgi:predicted nucleotidyltransferase
MTDPHGLTERDRQQIIEAIRQFDEILVVVLFGSRAKGNYKLGSDVDLAVKGDRITHRTVAQLADLLNEDTPLPYYFDIVHYDALEIAPLVEHIDRIGIVIYDRANELTQVFG